MRYKTDIFLATMLSFWFFASTLIIGWKLVAAAFLFISIYGMGFACASRETSKKGTDYFIKSFSYALCISVVGISLLYGGLYLFCEFPEEIPYIIDNIIDDYTAIIFGSSIPAALFVASTYAKFADRKQ